MGSHWKTKKYPRVRVKRSGTLTMKRKMWKGR
jgi:hypothetical protein